MIWWMLTWALAQDVPSETEPSTPETTADDVQAPLAGGRLEFDDRLVRGERAAGSVVLFDRAPRPLPALVPIRRDFQQWIILPVLGELDPIEPVISESKSAEVAPEVDSE